MGKKKAAAAREVSDGELEAAVRDLVSRASGLGRTEFKKELGDAYKKLDKRAVEIARELAGRRELYRWASGATKERFFAVEPAEAVGRAVAKALADGPLDEDELKRRLDNGGRGFGDLFKEWAKGAIGRGELFQHAARAGSKKKLGLQPPSPDIPRVLKPVFSALRRVLSTNDGKRISREAVLAALAKELGVPATAVSAESRQASRAVAAEPFEANRSSFLRALEELSAENVQNGLLPIRDLRARLHLDKQSFDRLTLELSRQGVVTLHHHDFPTSLSPSERQELVADERGTHYVGIALRRSHG